MPFWKKKCEDPWDRKPEEKKPAPIPDWCRPEEKPEPADCPWCGQPMVAGTLYGQSRGGMQWREGGYQGFLDSLAFTGMKIDLGFYEDAQYCPACRKMTLNIGRAMEKAGPNYTWENGKPRLGTQEAEESYWLSRTGNVKTRGTSTPSADARDLR